MSPRSYLPEEAGSGCMQYRQGLQAVSLNTSLIKRVVRLGVRNTYKYTALIHLRHYHLVLYIQHSFLSNRQKHYDKMTPKVFATGVTGYVGGDVLHTILQAHPDWQYSFLVRNRTRLGSLAKDYPSIRVVEGDLGDLDILKSEAASADIVLHFASSDNRPAVQAILEGLGSDSNVRFFIHTSGTANLLWDDISNGTLGIKRTKVYDDVEDIKTITSFPDAVPHRPVDKLVLGASATYPNIRQAIVCPPAILGVGRGAGNKRTIQVPLFVELSLQRGKVFEIEQGEAAWSFVHIHDLSDVYLRLTESAAVGGGTSDWGPEAYYFAENGELQWGAIARSIAKHLHEAGALGTDEVESLSAEGASKLNPMLSWTGGMNSKSRASRARRVLGWKPQVSDFTDSLKEVIQQDLEAEKTRLQEIAEGHFPKQVKE